MGRAEVKRTNPDASITDVSKACGSAWSCIDGATKSKYEKKSEDAKKTFDKQYKEWLANGGDEILKQEKLDKASKKKGSKGKAAPKKPAPKRGGKAKKKAETSEEEDEQSDVEAEESDY